MKKLLLPLCLCISMSSMGQNSLLDNPTTGAITSSSMTDLQMVSNGTDVVLCIGDNVAIYAIDIADNDASKAVANTITSIPNFITSKLNPLAGQTVTVADMAVNPISKSVYVLAKGGASNFLFKVENDGANVSLVDLSNITYSQISWGSNLATNDIAYGNNTLYVSSGSFTLDGELGWVSPPFKHNSTFTKRSTTLFKSNWGGQYFTSAPLEAMTFGNVDGKDRLMGVTTCAPGFSIDVTTLSGSGLLKVTEDFNIHQGLSTKATFMYHDGKGWLFDLHDNQIYRIGKKYLDGSQVTANKYDNNATMLRDNAGNVNASLPADEIKLMSTSSYQSFAYWDNYRLVVLETPASGGALKLSQMSTGTPPPTAISTVNTTSNVSIFPNPASGSVTISLPNGKNQATATIVSISGQTVLSQTLNNSNNTINVSNLSAGIYTVNVSFADGSTASNKLTIE